MFTVYTLTLLFRPSSPLRRKIIGKVTIFFRNFIFITKKQLNTLRSFKNSQMTDNLMNKITNYNVKHTKQLKSWVHHTPPYL